MRRPPDASGQHKDELSKRRKVIDALDLRIAPLLAARFRAAASLRGLKPRIKDTGREAHVLARAKAAARGRRLRAALGAAYTEIMRQSRRLQRAE